MRYGLGALSFLVLAVAGAVPCLAQSLEVSAGAPVRIEIAHVEALVEEGVARVEVDETFRNTTDAVQEGVYRFQLPEDAVIGSFSMWMNGKEKSGRVVEAVEARRVYDSIVRTRRDPGLLEQTGWRQFRVNVFPIPARDTVRVRLSYAHVVRDDLGLQTLEVALPQGAGAIGDLRVHAVVKSSSGVAGVDCPSQRDAKVLVDANGGDVLWSADGAQPGGPFVLRTIPRREGFDVALVTHRPAGAKDGWFVARLVPRLAAPPQIGRDVVFVVDRSGSMGGRKMEQAIAALQRGLDSLRPGDRFDLVSFASEVTSLGTGHLLDATPANLDVARRAARDLSASGGTNIDAALSAALAVRGEDPTRLSAVVFLTDGDPTVGETDPDRLLAAWRAKAGGTRLFALGVGADVKDFLLTKLATLGRGDAQYVREDEILEVKLSALVDRIRTPLLLDPTFDLESETVHVADREPQRLPDVFQGRALVVAGRYEGAGKAVLHLRGRSGVADVKIDVPVDFPAETTARPHVAQIWAKARIERLLDDLRASPNQEIRAEILRLGLTHQLVTPYTSFLVLEDGMRYPSGETASRDADDGAVADSTDQPVPPVSGATGGTALGVGVKGHTGTGSPSPYLSRSSGSGGRGGGGLGQGGGGGAGGSTKQTESAVMWGLRWLMNHQSSDGRWDSDGFETMCKLDKCGGAGDPDGDVEATGLALLAFLGAGETHQSGSCKDAVREGLKFLRDVQDADGCVGLRTAPNFLRHHAIGALALTEAYGMTGSRVFREPAEKAIAFIVQTKDTWLAKGADPVTVGWIVMALKSATMSKIDVDQQVLADVVAWFDAITDATGHVGVGEPTETFTGVGVVVRIFAGHDPKVDPAIVRGADLLRKSLPRWDVAPSHSAMADHFATIAMFQLGNESGGHWKAWNEAMKLADIDHQRLESDRDARGSWDPIGPDGAAGRVAVTALRALGMEVYYRYGRVLGVRHVPPPTPDGK